MYVLSIRIASMAIVSLELTLVLVLIDRPSLALDQ